jgi:hypothetical protein
VQKREEWKEKNKMGGYIYTQELLRMKKASVVTKPSLMPLHHCKFRTS